MGNVRPLYIKRVARRLVDRYPELFSDDFERNKELVEKLTDVQSKRMRNHIAGYATRYWRIKYGREEGQGS